MEDAPPGEDASVPPADMTDAVAPDADTGGSDGPACEQAERAFSEFVANNGSCELSSDCTVIGDCGPNADFTAVVAAAAEGYALMAARCDGSFDGLTFARGVRAAYASSGPRTAVVAARAMRVCRRLPPRRRQRGRIQRVRGPIPLSWSASRLHSSSVHC